MKLTRSVYPFFFSLLMMVACLPPVFSEDTALTVQSALKELQTESDYINTRYKTLNDLYYSDKSLVTLENAFNESGIGFSHKYTKSWGSWIWTDWAYTKDFYKNHVGALNSSINTIKRQGKVSPSDMSYLRAGIKTWRNDEKNIDQAYRELVRSYIDRARTLDDRKKVQDEHDKIAFISRTAPQEARLKQLKQQLEELNKRNKKISEFIEKTKKYQLSGKYWKKIVYSSLSTNSRVLTITKNITATVVNQPTPPCPETFHPRENVIDLTSKLNQRFEAAKTQVIEQIKPSNPPQQGEQ